MAFYKLFHLLHRRTDYDRKFYKVYYMMHPDKAEEKERRYQKAVKDLATMTAIMSATYSPYLQDI